jgi:hypothetical protein
MVSSPSVSKMAHLIRRQAFEVAELDPTIDFENALANLATMVIGWGQMVYWKGCNVTIYEKDSEGKEQITRLPHWPSGQIRLQSGTKLYITQGKFKEV